eukprot:s3480_g4.t1
MGPIRASGPTCGLRISARPKRSRTERQCVAEKTCWLFLICWFLKLGVLTKIRAKQPHWSQRFLALSPQAKDFVQKLFVDASCRLSAKEALEHPFLRLKTVKEERILEPGILRSLRKFARASAFRRALLSIVALSLSNEDRNMLHEQFLAMDRQKRGTITMLEMKSVLEETFHVDGAEAEALFSCLDTDNDDEIEYSEFLAAALIGRVQVHEDLLRKTFGRFDKSESGSITAENLRCVLGEHFGAKEMEDMIREADKSGHGQIDYDEFLAYFYRSDTDGLTHYSVLPPMGTQGSIAAPAPAPIPAFAAQSDLGFYGKMPSAWQGSVNSPPPTWSVQSAPVSQEAWQKRKARTFKLGAVIDQLLGAGAKQGEPMEFLDDEFDTLVHKLCAVHKKEITLLHDKIKFLHSPEGKKLFHHHQDHHEHHAHHEDDEEAAHALAPHAGHLDVPDAGNEGTGTGSVSITTLLDDRTGAPVGDMKASPRASQKHRSPWHHDAKGKPSKSHTWFQHKSTGSVSLSFNSRPLWERMKIIIHHPVFDCIMSALIVINAVMFAFEAQYRGFELATKLGISEDSAVTLWPGADMAFETAELIFGIIFTVEVCIKILVDRCEFFREGWNWLDFVVVVVWVFGKTGTALPVNSQILRLGRLFRLLRMLRLVRQMMLASWMLVSFLTCDAPSVLPEGATRREATALPYLAAWPKLSDNVHLSMVSVVQRRDDILNVDLATLSAMIREFLSELGAVTKFEEFYSLIASTAFRWNNAAQAHVVELPPMSTSGLSAACLLVKAQSYSLTVPTREEALRKRAEFALVATAVEFSLNAFVKINLSLLEQEAAKDRLEALDRAFRTHERGGAAAFCAMLQHLLNELFPGTKLPSSYALLRPESYVLRIADSRLASFTAWHVVFLGGCLMDQDILANYGGKMMSIYEVSELFAKEAVWVKSFQLVRPFQPILDRMFHTVVYLC